MHRLRSRLLSIILLFAGAISGCSSTPTLSWDELKAQIRQEFPTVTQMSIAELESRQQATVPGKLLIVDVRAPEEFAVSHLQGAVNLEDADAILNLAQQQQVEQIILYCSVGYRSARMAQMLEQQGWAAVVNLEGSIFEWANSGRAVFLGNNIVEVVHPFDPHWGQLLEQQYHPAAS